MRFPLYLGVMGASSALSLARGFIVASLLDAGSFGTYVVTVALGAFGSIILSAGRVEQTQKTYPRLWAEGRQREMLDVADRTARIVVFRATLLGAVVFLGCLLTGTTSWLSIAFAATCLAMLTASVSLYASALRASLDLHSMSTVGFKRAAASFIFGCCGGWLWSWQGAIAGELMGAAFGAWLSRESAKSRIPNLSNNTHTLAESSGKSGTWFFIWAITASVPSYLDRFFVANQWGNETAGSYGFLMLFVTGANVVTGIIVQKLGPQLVQMAHRGCLFRDQIRLVTAWVAPVSAAFLAGMLVSAYFLLVMESSDLAAKFGLGVQALALATVLCVFQLGHIIEWVLISRDRESLVSIAAIIHVSAAVVIAAVSAWLQWSITEFLGGLVFAKSIHVLVLLVFVINMIGGDRESKPPESLC